MAQPLIRMPSHAKPGEVIEIRALFAHPMETGFRLDATGNKIPRDIVNRFECRYDGEPVFRADLYPAIAANPYIVFHTVAVQTGELIFEWRDDSGKLARAAVKLTVA
ncbi:MAG: thiosulfate oxidation carrier complex protein SoxZ [Alphaproteobacteria bacterium]